MKQRDRFARGVEDELFRQQGLGGEMRQLVFGELVEALGPAEIEGRLAIRDVSDRRTKSYAGASTALRRSG